MTTPGLVERDTPLRVLDAALQAVAAEGAGRIVLVAGEAGVGKTSVLRAFLRAHPTTASWWGACDALQTPHPLAPLHDIAHDARPRFAARLNGPRPELFDAVLDELRHAALPTVVVIEDAHWADDATLDLLKFIGRRIERTRALLLVSYRDDEVTAAHPLRRVLGELPVAARTQLDIPRLTPEGVHELARRLGGRDDGVYEATRGNAFFATEMLRDTASPRAAVPRSVQDVVLARCAHLPERVQAVLQIVSLLPGRTERWLLDRVIAPDVRDLDAALASGLLVADATSLAYRHELGRVAVEASLSPPLAQTLHRRVLAALSEPGRDTPAARLVHHATAADDRDAVTRHAPQAAEEASRREAHHEAGRQWRIALERGAPADTATLMHWLERFVAMATLNAWHGEALAALQRLQTLHQQRGEVAEAARQLARQASPLSLTLRHPQAKAALQQALALVEALPDSPAKAQVWSMQCWQCMLDRDYADSVRWGRQAIAMARATGDATALDRARISTGAALLFVDFVEGRRMLLELDAERRAAGQWRSVAMGLTMIGSGCGELMHLAEAAGHLDECIALCEARDWEHGYALAWRALCRLGLGRWNEAAADAELALRRAAESDISRLMALLALARLRLRRGDPGAGELLDQALAMAAPSGTLQRLAPTACARAEAASMRGDRAAVVLEVDRVLALATAKGHPWFVGELNYWLWRAGAIGSAPEGCAEPYALEIGGHWREAAAAWAALGARYERARALSLGDAAAQQEALSEVESLGAVPAADALRRRLREAGVRGVLRGAREATRRHPCGLTGSEARVLALMAEGLRNAEIAARLHRSVRTVDHHVAAVLAKLEVDSRAEAVRRAERQGWLVGAEKIGNGAP